MLRAEHLRKTFKGVVAVDDVSFQIAEKEIVGMIGPNGSGKTTVLNLLANTIKRDAGDVYFKGICLNNMKPHQIVRSGIGRTFQICQVFENLTVLDNMRIVESNKERIDELLRFVGLSDLQNRRAYEMSGGQHRLLELAQVLALRPELVLLDEPYGGIHPDMIEEIAARIKQLNRQGVTFLIVEHNVRSLLKLCSRVIALDQGRIIADDVPEKVQQSEQVLKAYLGVSRR